MEVVLNGEIQQLPAEITIAQLLQQLGLQDKRLAMELNGEIVVRSCFKHQKIHAGDKIEIVHAVGGG